MSQTKDELVWNTEEEVERCAVVVDMEKINGEWVSVGSRPGRLYKPPSGNQAPYRGLS